MNIKLEDKTISPPSSPFQALKKVEDYIHSVDIPPKAKEFALHDEKTNAFPKKSEHQNRINPEQKTKSHMKTTAKGTEKPDEMDRTTKPVDNKLGQQNKINPEQKKTKSLRKSYRNKQTRRDAQRWL